MRHEDYFTTPKQIKGGGYTVYHPDHFPEFYAYKLKSFTLFASFAKETDFINSALRICDSMLKENEKELQDCYKSYGITILSAMSLEHEILLIERWREYLTDKKASILNEVNMDAVTDIDNKAFVLTENRFNGDVISVNEAYTFFHTHLKKFADANTIDKFLQLAFYECKTPKRKINLKQTIGRKLEVMNVFYKFFQLSSGQRGEATKYAELLSCYFVGYNIENVKVNWNKV